MKKPNHIAKDLRTPKYRKRVTRDKSKYNRKDKEHVRIRDRATRTGTPSNEE
jgi:hypothetical protein